MDSVHNNQASNNHPSRRSTTNPMMTRLSRLTTGGSLSARVPSLEDSEPSSGYGSSMLLPWANSEEKLALLEKLESKANNDEISQKDYLVIANLLRVDPLVTGSKKDVDNLITTLETTKVIDGQDSAILYAELANTIVVGLRNNRDTHNRMFPVDRA